MYRIRLMSKKDDVIESTYTSCDSFCKACLRLAPYMKKLQWVHCHKSFDGGIMWEHQEFYVKGNVV